MSQGLSSVQGYVAPGARPLDHARALAIGTDGTVRWTRLDAKGAFSLSLPAGRSYRLLVANELASGGLRVVGHLVMQTSRGPNAWLALYDTQPIVLGGLHLTGAPASSTGGLHTNDVEPPSSDQSDSSSADDGETQEGDAEDTDTCASHDGEADDDEALESDDDVSNLADPEHDGDDGDAEDGSPCPPTSGPPSSGPPSSGPPSVFVPPPVVRIPWGPSSPQPK